MSEYLKVLKMTPGEQQVWWDGLYWEEEAKLGSIRECSIPSAAFCLRDEANEGKYGNELYEVFEYHKKTGKSCTYHRWLECRVKPIDMIIAALIAKETSR